MFARKPGRWSPAVLAVGLVLCGLQVPATASTAGPAGRLTIVRQDTFTHTLRIKGWALDPARPRAAVRVRIYVDGVRVRTVLADEPSARANRVFGLTGAHGYAVTLANTARARVVTVRSRGARGTGRLATLSNRRVAHHYPPAGQRIVAVAKRFVGGRYVEGGATPRGFDCSGYTMYAYAHAHVRRLAHNADAQRRALRPIRRAQARPGDLVFYLSGGHAYHVAIYAGHGWQYAAATVRDGIRHQRVWSRNVRYGTARR
jgi:cell wall-associated NlpC family hydrolase